VSFEYAHATTLPDALAALAAEGTLPVAGGTDLVPCVDEGILTPSRVLDIRGLPGARDITIHADGSATIGAAVRISDLATHQQLRARFPVLAEAAASVGTPALRNMGTIGGNLVQRHHCWYFRRGVGCFKRGGTQCAAVEGEHEYHGIVADGTCRAVHPSDPAVALEVLDATVVVARAGATERRVSIAELFAGAAGNALSEVTLAHGELITAIELPAASAGGVQHWEKVMQRGAWDFALVSCAAVRRADGAVRLALGGVALAPWRIALSVEEDIASGGLDEDSIDALAERAMYDVEPLARNGYKVTLAQTVLKRAMQALG